MKKAIGLVLAIAMLGMMAASALATEEYGYYAIGSWWDKDEVGAAANGIPGDVLYACIVGTYQRPLSMPEMSKEELQALDRKGLKLFFNEPLNIVMEGNVVKSTDIDMQTLAPTRIELAGEIAYGIINEIGDDYVVHTIHGANQKPERYTITPDTVMWYESTPFHEGSGCEIIVDANGVALAMIEGNG